MDSTKLLQVVVTLAIVGCLALAAGTILSGSTGPPESPPVAPVE